MKKKKMLFCFPYAGGSGMIYMPWREELNYTVYPMEYRGHATRRKEPLDSSIEEIAKEMARIIVKHSPEYEGFSLFGHSMGGLVAYTTALFLQKEYGLVPDRLFLSACGIIRNREELGAGVHGIPPVLLNHAEHKGEAIQTPFFVEHILPVTKHDLTLAYTYCIECAIQHLKCPVTCFAGKKDEFDPIESMKQWNLVSDDVELITFEGGHFYFEEENNKNKLFTVLNQYSE